MWYVRRFCLTGVCAACCLLLLDAPVEAAFTIQQLTNNGYDDFYPQVGGQHVVWQGEVAVGNDEVFHYNLGSSTTTRITNEVGPTYNDWNPMVSGTDVVWEKQDPVPVGATPTKVFHWNESTGISTDLTPGNAFHNYSPQIDGRIVTWQNENPANWEIVVHDLMSSTQQAIVRVGKDAIPAVSGMNVVWQGLSGGNEEIFHFSATGPNSPPWLAPLAPTAQITNDPRAGGTWHDEKPRLSGNALVWEATDLAGQSDVFTYDLGAAVPTVTNVSNHPWNDSRVQVDGSIMVWQRWDDTDDEYEILYCDLSQSPLTPIQITNNPDPQSDWNPQVSGHYIVWYGDTTPANQSSDPDNYEIFLYDTNIGQTFQITNNNVPDWMPQIDGLQVVWSGVGASGNYEIFTTIVPEPGAMVLLAIAGLGLGVYAWRRRRS